MKYVKTFENFTEEEKLENYPKSITIKLTDKFIRRMEDFKIGEVGKTGVAIPGIIKLWNDGKSHNMIKIGRLRSDEYNYKDIEKDYWISYHPDIKEVKLDESITTTESRKKYGEINEITKKCQDEGSLVYDDLRFNNFNYGKFENGFKVGEVDHVGYFKIIGVE